MLLVADRVKSGGLAEHAAWKVTKKLWLLWPKNSFTRAPLAGRGVYGMCTCLLECKCPKVCSGFIYNSISIRLLWPAPFKHGLATNIYGQQMPAFMFTEKCGAQVPKKNKNHFLHTNRAGDLKTHVSCSLARVYSNLRKVHKSLKLVSYRSLKG